ncbi:MAG TPA: hypothetical protein VI653_15430 [Steroidobacteraceae bacterium]
MSGLQQALLWKIGTGAFAVIAIAASFCAYQRSGDATALRAQLAGVNADLNRAHDQISLLTGQLSASQTQVTLDRQELATAQQQVTNESMQLTAASRPDLPVRLWFRHAMLSQGEVAMLQNLSSQTLEINLEVQSPAAGVQFRHTLVINPGQVGQFGPQEGWAFASGQLVTLSHPAFRPIRQTVGG